MSAVTNRYAANMKLTELEATYKTLSEKLKDGYTDSVVTHNTPIEMQMDVVSEEIRKLQQDWGI